METRDRSVTLEHRPPGVDVLSSRPTPFSLFRVASLPESLRHTYTSPCLPVDTGEGRRQEVVLPCLFGPKV